jgi:transcriptional regulator with XRE-family HTH domain
MAPKASTHVLRTTRKLYGFSQQKLANLVGCSLSTVKFIETLRLRPSADLAHRVYLETGLDPQQLIGNFSPGNPRDPTGQPLTTETINLRQGSRLSDEQAREHVDSSLALYSAVLEALLDAAVRQKKLWALRPAFQAVVDKLLKDFDLEKDFRRILLDRYGVRDPWSTEGYAVAKSLYMIVNAPLFENPRKAAELKRNEFYGNIQKLPVRKPSGRTAA